MKTFPAFLFQPNRKKQPNMNTIATGPYNKVVIPPENLQTISQTINH